MAAPKSQKRLAAEEQIAEMKAQGLTVIAMREKLREAGLTAAQLNDLLPIVETEKKLEEAPQKPAVDIKAHKESLMEVFHGLEFCWKNLATVDRPSEKNQRNTLIILARKLKSHADAL